MNANTDISRRKSLTLALTAGTAAILYSSGLIGVGAVHAGQKAIPGIGIRIRKNPGGNTRMRAVASDGAGRFSVTVSDAGDQSVDIDKAALQLAVNADAAANRAGAAERLVIVRFAPGLRVTGPGGQAAIAGQPGTFVLSPGNQTFMVKGVAAGTVISGVIETADFADLFPGTSSKGIKDQGVKGCGNCGVTGGRMISNPDGDMAVGVSGK